MSSASDDSVESAGAFRVTLRMVWDQQQAMAQTLQSVAQAVTPLVGQVERLQSDKLGVADYKYERDVRDHQAGEFRTDIETRIRVAEKWIAARSGATAALLGIGYIGGGATVAVILNHVVK